MKTLRISDDAHLKLTALLGELTAQTMRMQTYTDAIENLLSQSVSVPPELLAQIERLVEKNKHLGFPTKDEFIRDAIRWRLHILGDEYECLEIQREDYEKAQRAIKDMELPFWNVAEFVERQIKGLIEKYDEWLKQKEAYEQTRRKSR